jgi:hypothetical protein
VEEKHSNNEDGEWFDHVYIFRSFFWWIIFQYKYTLNTLKIVLRLCDIEIVLVIFWKVESTWH